MTQLERTTRLLYKEAVPAKIGIRDGSPIIGGSRGLKPP